MTIRPRCYDPSRSAHSAARHGSRVCRSGARLCSPGGTMVHRPAAGSCLRSESAQPSSPNQAQLHVGNIARRKVQSGLSRISGVHMASRGVREVPAREGNKMRSSKVSFFERLARRCAQRPWHVIIIWVMLLAVGATLFATVFSKNMTTVTEFTTDTDSKKADDLFKERFPQAAYKVENAVITSDTYTADDPEFWAYVDGLYAKLQSLRDSGVVKDVQYYDPALREGLPLMPAMLQQMVDAMELALDEESTSAELAQAAATCRPRPPTFATWPMA